MNQKMKAVGLFVILPLVMIALSPDLDVDAARAIFVEKLQELRKAIQDGDSEKASELRDELKDLRGELGNLKSYRK